MYTEQCELSMALEYRIYSALQAERGVTGDSGKYIVQCSAGECQKQSSAVLYQIQISTVQISAVKYKAVQCSEVQGIISFLTMEY